MNCGSSVINHFFFTVFRMSKSFLLVCATIRHSTPSHQLILALLPRSFIDFASASVAELHHSARLSNGPITTQDLSECLEASIPIPPPTPGIISPLDSVYPKPQVLQYYTKAQKLTVDLHDSDFMQDIVPRMPSLSPSLTASAYPGRARWAQQLLR